MERDSHRFKIFFELLHEDSVWKVQKVCNMATLHREYQGIHSLPKLSFADTILNPAAVSSQHQEYFEIPDKLREVLELRYNSSQFTAIKSSLKKNGITLIQGPPGTGKTNTILGILSVLLNTKDKNDAKRDLPAAHQMVEERIPLEKKSDDYKKKQFAKAMPWLRAGYANPRDHDKSKIELPLEKHLVYPISILSDE